MPSTPSSALRLELQATGESLNTWGQKINDRALLMLEEAITKNVSIALTGNRTLSTVNFTTDEARSAALIFTDGGLSAAPTVTIPPVPKIYYVENRGATYPITFNAGGATGSLAAGRKAHLICNGSAITIFDPKAEGAAIQAAAEAARDAALAYSVLTAADRVQTGLDRTQTGLDRVSTTASAVAAAASYDAFDDRYLGPKAANPTVDNDGDALLVGALYFNTVSTEMRVWSGTAWGVFNPTAAGYYTKTQTDALIAAIPASPPILPIALTSPAAGATGVGTGGAYTFVGTSYYSLYGVAQASRAVRIYNAAGTTLVTTFSVAGAGTTVSATLAGVLAVNTPYLAEMVYTDDLGNTAASPKVAFTTATVFKPARGQAYEGGFLGPEFGDGYLYDLILAAKSTESNRQWFPSGAVLTGVYSRTNGPGNLAFFNAQGYSGVSSYAIPYAGSTLIGGVAGYLPAMDEMLSVAQMNALFPSAERLDAGATISYWVSTEIDAANAKRLFGASGVYSENSQSKTASILTRAIRRIQVPLPAGLSYGQAYEGGFLVAAFTDMSVALPNTFLLILSDKATEVTRAFAPSSTSAPTGDRLSRTNGLLVAAQFFGAGNADATSGDLTTYPALAYCRNLTSGTKSDWYLPAIDELLAVARMNSLLPSGQQLTLANKTWASTEIDASNAKILQTGLESQDPKTSVLTVRAVRRVLLPTS